MTTKSESINLRLYRMENSRTNVVSSYPGMESRLSQFNLVNLPLHDYSVPNPAAGTEQYIEMKSSHFAPTGAGLTQADRPAGSTFSAYREPLLENIFNGLPASTPNPDNINDFYPYAYNCDISIKIPATASFTIALEVPEDFYNSVALPTNNTLGDTIIHNADETKIMVHYLSVFTQGAYYLLFQGGFQFDEQKFLIDDCYLSSKHWRVKHLPATPTLYDSSQPNKLICPGNPLDNGVLAQEGKYIIDAIANEHYEIEHVTGINNETIITLDQNHHMINPSGVYYKNERYYEGYELYLSEYARQPEKSMPWEKIIETNLNNEMSTSRPFGKITPDNQILIYPQAELDAGETEFHAGLAFKAKPQNSDPVQWYATQIRGEVSRGIEVSQSHTISSFFTGRNIETNEVNLLNGETVSWKPSITAASYYITNQIEGGFYSTTVETTNCTISGSQDEGVIKSVTPNSQNAHYRAVIEYEYNASPYSNAKVQSQFVVEGFHAPVENFVVYNSNHEHPLYHYGQSGTDNILSPATTTATDVHAFKNEALGVKFTIYDVDDEILDELEGLSNKVTLSNAPNVSLYKSTIEWKRGPDVSVPGIGTVNTIVSTEAELKVPALMNNYSADVNLSFQGSFYRASVSGMVMDDYGLLVKNEKGGTRLNTSSRQFRFLATVSGYAGSNPVAVATTTNVPALDDLVDDGSWHFTVNARFAAIKAFWDFTNKQLIVEPFAPSTLQPAAGTHLISATDYYEIIIFRG